MTSRTDKCRVTRHVLLIDCQLFVLPHLHPPPSHPSMTAACLNDGCWVSVGWLLAGIVVEKGTGELSFPLCFYPLSKRLHKMADGGRQGGVSDVKAGGKHHVVCKHPQSTSSHEIRTLKNPFLASAAYPHIKHRSSSYFSPCRRCSIERQFLTRLSCLAMSSAAVTLVSLLLTHNFTNWLISEHFCW